MFKKYHLLTFCLLTTFALLTLSQPSIATKASPEYKCLTVPNSVCVNNGKTILTTDNKPSTLKGWWTFDDKFASDQSGNKNDMYPVPAFGPAFGGNGYSGKYNYSNYSTINNIEAYNSNEFTLSFWIYLLQDSVGVWRTIIHKGNKYTETTPTVQLWPNENRLHVRVSTDTNWNDGIDSNGALMMGRWSHVAVIVTNQLIQLFLNGQLDNQAILESPVALNNGPFHVGGDPWHPGVGMFIDDIRFYDAAIKQDVLVAWVQAFVPFYNGGFYASLGCASCNYFQAVNSCPDGYQLCSMPELYVGGYWTARINGWFRNNIDLWVRVDFNDVKANDKKDYTDVNVYKMGICCQM